MYFQHLKTLENLLNVINSLLTKMYIHSCRQNFAYHFKGPFKKNNQGDKEICLEGTYIIAFQYYM